MSANGRGVFYLGLDACDADVVRQGVRDGMLPGMRDLFARGLVARVTTPEALFVGAVWPSFWSSCGPARHGRCGYDQLVPGTYRVVTFETTSIPLPPFWRAMCRAGKRVHVFDVPKTAPDREILGEHVLDWATHDPELGGFRAHPPETLDRVRAAIGDTRNAPCDEQRTTAEDFRAFGRAMEERTLLRERWLAARLDEPYDAVIACHTEGHCAGHQTWHLHDPSHPRHDRALAEAAGDVMMDTYRVMDASVGRLVARAAGRRIVVHLSHGMGPHYDGSTALDDLLEALERFLPPGRPPTFGSRIARAFDVPRTRKWNRKFRRRFGRRLPFPSRHASRLCFAVPNNEAWAGIRVNLVGREPAGRVEPGPPLDRFLATLAERLAEVRDAATGAPVFARIERTGDLYRREEGDPFPDLVAEWRRELPIGALTHPAAGQAEAKTHGLRTGDHRAEGLAVFLGEGLGKGESSRSLRIEDLGPTLASWLGVVVPDVDGRPFDAS